jgi:hypothetical protein
VVEIGDKNDPGRALSKYLLTSSKYMGHAVAGYGRKLGVVKEWCLHQTKGEHLWANQFLEGKRPPFQVRMFSFFWGGGRGGGAISLSSHFFLFSLADL